MTAASRRICSLCFLLLAIIVGCSGRSSSRVNVEKNVDFEPQVDLVSRLQKPTDLQTAAKDVIQAIESSSTKMTPTPLSAAEFDDLKKSLSLVPAEEQEITRVGLSPSGLDVPYLAECLLLHDAMASLSLSRVPPLRRAELALEWVGRQVIPQESPVPAAPAWFVLQRGSGRSLERAAVFLAALRQLGLDAGLVGPKDLGQQRTVIRQQDGNVRFAPFWAVGVLIDKQVYLFDPVTAKPFPGADGKGIASLSQLVADPKLGESWAAAKLVNAADLKEPKVYLCPPLSGLAPRMKSLEEKLKSNGVKLSVNLPALMERFRAVLDAKVEVTAWNPPEDPFTPTRTLAYFLPSQLGGLPSRDKNAATLFAVYLNDTLRLDLLTLNVQDIGEARSMLTNSYRAQLEPLFLFGPNLPRERLVRGLLDDAVQKLRALMDVIESNKIRVERDPSAAGDIARWTQELDTLIARQKRAQRTNNQEELDRALKDRAEFERDPKKRQIFESFVVRSTSRVQSAESTYLVALAVHEQAERYQIRLETDKQKELQEIARESWVNAREWWNRYLQNYPELRDVQLERNKHARELLSRVESFLPTGKEKK